MQSVCPNCKFLNREGVIFCDNCGTSLLGEVQTGLSTHDIGANQTLETQSNPNPTASSNLGSDRFGQAMLLRFEIEGAEALLLKPQQETIIGRRDPATGAMPDVDMTPFAGYRMGVSRRHAAIRRSEDNRLDLWDLGSSNGTYLNNTRLVSYRPNRLRDGDEVRFGQMTVRIYFQVNPTSTLTSTDTTPRKSTVIDTQQTAKVTANPDAALQARGNHIEHDPAINPQTVALNKPLTSSAPANPAPLADEPPKKNDSGSNPNTK